MTRPFPVRFVLSRVWAVLPYSVPATLQTSLLGRSVEAIYRVLIVTAGMLVAAFLQALVGTTLAVKNPPLSIPVVILFLTGMTSMLRRSVSLVTVLVGQLLIKKNVLTVLLPTWLVVRLGPRHLGATLSLSSFVVVRTSRVLISAFDFGLLSDMCPFPRLVIESTFDVVSVIRRTDLGHRPVTVCSALVGGPFL